MPVAILTGAGKGMGGAAARELAARGWNVALLSPSGNAETLAKELGGIGITGSVTDPADLARLVDGAMNAWGRIDGAVLSTGHPPKGDLLALSDEDWAKGLDLIILNVVRICRLITPIMEKQGGGAIVNISTFAAFEPDPVFPISCTLRAGLASFAKLYADRYAAQNIRMNNLLPGFIDSLPEKEMFKARIPMKRYGTVAEIAKTAAFLLSEDAGYITGQNIRVDGGITRSV
ncbi:MAG: SDR family oxidoreductase [Beijerinckiaceae bacterium]|nr:SDR family oxidoreductase [Beijerinckiaceae bacterium]MCZ8301895.1 SDR family oxidoreductase [Beijerinckiaceae bacterium]